MRKLPLLERRRGNFQRLRNHDLLANPSARIKQLSEKRQFKAGKNRISDCKPVGWTTTKLSFRFAPQEKIEEVVLKAEEVLRTENKVRTS